MDLGALDRRRRRLERGGHVYACSRNDAAAVRRSFREAFLGWQPRADALVDEPSREGGVEATVETDSPAPQWRIYGRRTGDGADPGGRSPTCGAS